MFDLLIFNYDKVFIPFDQYMCLKYFNWRSRHFSCLKGIWLSILTVLAFCFLNIHLNFTFEYELLENSSFIETCKNSTILESWLRVNISF